MRTRNLELDTRVRTVTERFNRALIVAAAVFTVAIVLILLGTLINVANVYQLSKQNKATLVQVRAGQIERQQEIAQLQSMLAQTDANTRVELQELGTLFGVHATLFPSVTPVRVPPPATKPTTTSHGTPSQSPSPSPSPSRTSATPTPLTPAPAPTPTLTPVPPFASTPGALCLLVICVPLD